MKHDNVNKFTTVHWRPETQNHHIESWKLIDFIPINILWENDDFKKHQFRGAWHDTPSIIHPGYMLKIYICIYFDSSFFIVFL